ncbi:hypothetical protein E4O03_04490 [Treponema sp. OMZ 792]|uniref:hypothetical protein n=1 Tax=unclassified Treponema TaxID=2638727 RepID=UPI0020A28568|nr:MULTISPECIES: hypothetical protein [unclassified Treponema]UTC75973.1 hypothetical protein E4O03_04490 [Treponema sp. OMZ 792]UTC79974.1 hypothetical protein E4O07_04510 [Treponema sp. OMZ 798]
MTKDDFLYTYAKERYEYEQERKNQLNGMISIPLGLISILFACLTYFFKNIPPADSNACLLIIFYSFLLVSIIILAVCIYFFVMHQIGYDYAYIQDPSVMHNYQRQLYEYHKKNGFIAEQIDRLVENELIETLYDFYVKGSQKNIKNNEKKIKTYRNLIMSIIINIALFSFTFFLRFLLPETVSPVVKINSDRPIVFSVDNKIPIQIQNPIVIENEIPIPIEQKNGYKAIDAITVTNFEDTCFKEQELINNNFKE